MIAGIYVIFNRISKKVYIGSSFDINRRFYKHKNQLKLNNHPNYHLQYAYNKYGSDCLKFTCIKVFDNKISDEDLRKAEQVFINKINQNRLYNLCPVAGSTKGKIHSQKTKDKISKSLTGKKYTRKGVIPSEETKQKIANSLRNFWEKNKTAEVKHIQRYNPKKKTVLQISLDTGEILQEFESTHDVERILGINSSHISSVCNGKRKSAGKYKWRYK